MSELKREVFFAKRTNGPLVHYDAIQRKQEGRSKAISDWMTELSPLDVEITEIDSAKNLPCQIARDTYTAVQLVTAYCNRASLAQTDCNCLTEVFSDQALARSHELDARVVSHGGETIGPLYGIPISLKDNFSVSGVATTVGIASWIERATFETNSVIAQNLLHAGAVIFEKTNVPPALAAVETVNDVFGRTTNQFNHWLSVGPNYGGDAALIAIKSRSTGEVQSIAS